MSESPSTPESDPAPPGPGESPVDDSAASTPTLPKEALPPVQPPTAGFIMQLFFIPLVIVSIIVAVWLMFSWMAQMGSKPEDLVASLERLDPGSWQSAKTLADILRTSQNDEVRNDENLAGRLAALLDSQLELGEQERYPPVTKEEKENLDQLMQQVWLRSFLCRALGEFEVPNGVPVLIEAAGADRHPMEIKVRRSAVWALSQHLARAQLEETDIDSWDWGDREEGWPEREALYQVLADASMEQSPGEAQLLRPLTEQERAERDEGKTRQQLEDEATERELAGDRLALRSTSVFALGLLGTPQALDHLALKLSDPHPDVRANAAAGLARAGDARGVETLLKMLDPENKEFVAQEAEADKPWKRVQIMNTALAAALLYAQENPAGQGVDQLRQAAAEVAEAEVHAEVTGEAVRVRDQIESLQAG